MSGDPRLSVAERYRDDAGYAAAVTAAANALRDRRLLLSADVAAYVNAAQAATADPVGLTLDMLESYTSHANLLMAGW